MVISITDKALAYCKNIKLDLVEVVPTVNPPVCKALDFGKFRFQSAKKKQTAKTTIKRNKASAQLVTNYKVKKKNYFNGRWGS